MHDSIQFSKDQASICFHVGTELKDFSFVSLKQARYTNPKANIFLIHNDLSPEAQEQLTQYNLILVNIKTQLPTEQALLFDQFYKERLQADASPSDSILNEDCFKRFFHFKNLMLAYQLDWLFAVDADVLIYSSVEKLYHNSKGKYLCGLGCDKTLVNGFLTLALLEKLCPFIIDFYKNHSEESLDKFMLEQKFMVEKNSLCIIDMDVTSYFLNKVLCEHEKYLDLNHNPYFQTSDSLVTTTRESQKLKYLKRKGLLPELKDASYSRIIKLHFCEKKQKFYALRSRKNPFLSGKRAFLDPLLPKKTLYLDLLLPKKKLYFDLLHFSWFVKPLIYHASTYNGAYKKYPESVRLFLEGKL